MDFIGGILALTGSAAEPAFVSESHGIHPGLRHLRLVAESFCRCQCKTGCVDLQAPPERLLCSCCVDAVKPSQAQQSTVHVRRRLDQASESGEGELGAWSRICSAALHKVAQLELLSAVRLRAGALAPPLARARAAPAPVATLVALPVLLLQASQRGKHGRAESCALFRRRHPSRTCVASSLCATSSLSSRRPRGASCGRRRAAP